MAGERHPLVIVSHGRTGWSTGHHDTAAALANAGFIVAAINHPIDSNMFDKTRIDDLAYLLERPADITRLIDFVTMAWPSAAKVASDRIGFFGFSRGG